MTLSIKQRRFIDHYLESGNATEAAKRAGYSEKTAAVIGSENLRKPNIRDAIEIRLKENAMSVDEALSLLAEFARGDLGDVFNFIDGVKQPYVTVTPENVRLIKKFKRDITGQIEVELEDRQAAIDKILKVAGAYITKQEISGPGGGAVNIALKWSEDDNGDADA